jgi:hypothetical protein
MKKTLLLTTALGLAGASSLMAANVDVFITGSTAFRANVYTACQKLFVGGNPSVYFANTANGGKNVTTPVSDPTIAGWAMTGTPISDLTNLQGSTLVIHALFTGSIQGMQTVEGNTPLTFAVPDGTTQYGNCSTYVSASPTIGFSDASGSATPYPAVAPYVEEDVAVQPFVMVKSMASVGAVTSINNVTWEQMEYGIPQGRIPLAAWTSQMADTNTFVYLLQRTKDSGTRRCLTAGQYFTYNNPVKVFIYDETTNGFYLPTSLTAVGNGLYPSGVVGPAGLGNANLNWGYGYVGGGNIKTALKINNANNQAIAMLSIGDAMGLGSSNWAQVVSFNGVWPTTDGANIRGNTVAGFGSHTNDYSPITLGYYPCWGKEVVVYPASDTVVGTVPQTGNNITYAQLGNNQSPGTFMGVFNAQTLNNGGLPMAGSIENEIELSKTNMATAIRLNEMQNSRSAVGGTITPPWN